MFSKSLSNCCLAKPAATNSCKQEEVLEVSLLNGKMSRFFFPSFIFLYSRIYIHNDSVHPDKYCITNNQSHQLFIC